VRRRHQRRPRERLDVERLRVFAVDPVASAAQVREALELLGGHDPERSGAPGAASEPAPLSQRPRDADIEPSMAPKFELDPSVQRSQTGRLLAGGTPPKRVRLNEREARILDAILAGEPLEADADALARELSGTGMIAPLPPPAPTAVELTTVIPVHNGGPELADLIASLLPRGEVIVVDDRSTDGSGELAAAAGARVVANTGTQGPGGARNTGLRAARSELVAFVDADCLVEIGWSDGLAALLQADPDLAVVGPRVRSAEGDSRVARYERRFSPLDLGPLPGVVGHGLQVGYLPAAALVGRRETLLSFGGFDESLRFGEDVDLIWRLAAAGHLVRYVPQVEIEHSPRPSLSALLRQRWGYGTAAPEIEDRHPGAAAPLRASPASYLIWLAALHSPLSSAAVLALDSWRATRGPEPGGSRQSQARAVAGEHFQASLRLAHALSREWLPLTAVAALSSRRLRRLLALALAADAVTTGLGRSGPRLAGPLVGCLRLMDNAAYAGGLWTAAARRRAPAALLPRLKPRRCPKPAA